MTTRCGKFILVKRVVVEAYRLDRYDNKKSAILHPRYLVVEAYRLDRYDN